MAFDLSILDRPLAPSPGLDTLDPRLQEIMLLVPDGRFREAAEKSQALLAEGIHDVRLVLYLLHGAFLEGGPMALGAIFHALGRSLGDNWASIGPEQKKDKIADTSLKWFLKTLARELRGHLDAHDEVWSAWLAAATVDGAKVAVDGLAACRGPIADRFPDGGMNELVQAVASWLSEFQPLVAGAHAPPPPPEPAAPEPEPPPARERAAGPAPAAAPGLVLVEGSPALALLVRKMQAFEMLVERGDFPKASLVASDVSQTITNFDPKVFFPKLLTRFYELLFRNIEEVAPHWQEKDSIGWSAMEQLYQCDLDAFVETPPR